MVQTRPCSFFGCHFFFVSNVSLYSIEMTVIKSKHHIPSLKMNSRYSIFLNGYIGPVWNKETLYIPYLADTPES